MKQAYKDISFEAQELIHFFKNKNIDIRNEEYLIKRIESLTSFEYLFLLDKILLEVEINFEVIQVLFDFHYQKEEDELILDRTNNELVDIYFRVLSTDFITAINNYDLCDRVIYLMNLKNEYINDYFKLKDNVIEKIQFLKNIYDLKVNCKEISEILEVDEPESYPFETNRSIVYKEVSKSIFDKIEDDAFIFVDQFHRQEIDYVLNKEIELACRRLKKLSLFNFPKNDYKYQMLYPLIYDIEDWKKNIAIDISKNIESFENIKDYYIECLKEFETRTSQDFLIQLIDQKTEVSTQKTYGIESTKTKIPGPIKIDALIDWIRKTFESPKKNNGLNLISIIDELPSNSTIVLSPKFSQPQLLNILLSFFNNIEVKLTNDRINSIKSFVSNFTKFNEKVHHKKIIDKVPYTKIDFIERKHFKDFVRIFYILREKSNGLILSKKTDLTNLFVDLFYCKETKQGYSIDTLKKLKYEFSKEQNKFKSSFRFTLSTYQRDYFLP